MSTRPKTADPLLELDQWAESEAPDRISELLEAMEPYLEQLAPAIDWQTALLKDSRQLVRSGDQGAFEAAHETRQFQFQWEALITEWRRLWTRAVRGPAGRRAPEVRGGDLWVWSDVTIPRSVASRCWGSRREGSPPKWFPIVPELAVVVLEDQAGSGLRFVGGSEANDLGAICQPGHPCRMTVHPKAPPFTLGRPTVTTANLQHYLDRRREASRSGGSIW